MKKEIYMDNSSTTSLYDGVVVKMKDVLENMYGNPSSVHRLGLEAERAVKEARGVLEDYIGFNKDKIFFTSGGTEADNWAVFSTVEKQRKFGNRIITSKVEHPAILEPMKKLEKQGFEVIYLPVDEFCNIDMQEYQNALTEDTIFISLMGVNNEIGTIMPIEQMYLLKPQNAIFHSDFVQGLGKIDIPKIDMVSISSHKIHGPKGIGALALKDDIQIDPFIYGGGQERGMRGGTENTLGIVGFAEAIKNNKSADKNNIRKLKEKLKKGILDNIKDVRINTPENSVATVLNVSFLGVKSQVLLQSLELENIFVSAGSACSSKKKGGSHVLLAMGLKQEEQDSAIRFSLNEFITEEDIDLVIEKVKEKVDSIRKISRYKGVK